MSNGIVITAIICITLIAIAGILGSVFKKMIEVQAINNSTEERKDDNA